MSATATEQPVKIESRITDFSSRFSPVLVKELRQGMRTNLFVIAFILLQTFMILCLLAGIADPGSSDISGFFWFFIIVTLLIVQPLRGFSALSSEYSMNTMDLIQLTRLDGWRITLGKWTALNAQGLLFIAGVLPYLVIRYYLGNVNFVNDLVVLVLIGLGSGLSTAITIGCSVFKNIILRGAILVGVFFLTSAGWSIASLSRISGSVISSGFVELILFSLVGVYGIIFFLSFGASRIAPLSENLATRKRFFAVGFVLLAQVFHFFDAHESVIAVSAIILGFALVDALTEPLPIFSRVLAPFRNKPLGAALSLIFSPGWISGLFFFAFTLGLFLFLILIDQAVDGTSINMNEIEEWVVFLSYANYVLFPVFIIHLFFSKQSSHHFTFGVYVFIQAALFVLTLMIVAIGNALSDYEQIIYLFFPLPSVFIYAGSESYADTSLHLGIAISTLLLCFTFPLTRQRDKVREFFAAMRKPKPTEDAAPTRGD